MIVVIVLILIGVGSVAFHFWSPWWWTPIASNWSYIDDTILITFWITGVVFMAVILFMAYCVYRFRFKEGKRAEYKPENKKLEWWLSILTALGVVGMLAPGLFVWSQFINVPEDAVEFEALAQQWQWTFRLPGDDGVLGKVDTRNITYENPFGLHASDPNGQDDLVIESDEVHIQLGKPVKVLLRSMDVLHNFYVPQFRAKMDIVPGMVTYFWFTPIRTGTFEILCFELCGIGHYAMRGTVVVDEESAYRTWLREQPTFAETIDQARNGTGKVLDLASGADPPRSLRAK